LRIVLAVLVLFAGACASERVVQAQAIPVKADAMPSSLLGLTAAEEDVSKPFKEAGDRAFITGVRMWSLRQGTRLRATLEVARFAPDAPSTTEAFRKSVAAQVGGSAPRLRKIGDDEVYVASGNRQVYYTWFRGVHLVLLSVPADTTNGKALLRAALGSVKP
jgi:hypothetical protein